MKKLFIGALCFSAIFCANAQNKLDLKARSVMEREKPAVQLSIKSDGEISVENNEMIGMIIELEDGESSDALKALGAVILTEFDGFVACYIPVEKLGALDNEATVKKASLSRKGHFLNDKSRQYTKVDEVHSGTDLAMPYKGKDVVVGIFDGGLDPNHITFMEADNNTQSRVKRVWRYRPNGSVSSYTTEAQIKNFQTDDKNETHGTHVLSTAAGSYDSGVTDKRYHGMAPEAEIAIACGDMSEENILAGVENIIKYAESEGKPCTINLSLGTNDGPHDGSDAFTKALNILAERAVINLASGNEQEDGIALQKTLTSSDNQLKTFLTPNTYYLSGRWQAVGYIDIYGDDSTPFDCKFALCDKNGNVVYSIDAQTGKTVSASGTYFTGAYASSSYGAAYARMGAEVDANNNRYHVLLDLNLYNKTAAVSYYPAIIITGETGKTYRLFSEAFTSFSNRGLTGWDNATKDGTINGWACGPNTIAVGAYCSRAGFGNLVNRGSYYSSYGTLFDGRTLPDVCAPGDVIRSAYSTYYSPSSVYGEYVRDTRNVNGKDYTWGDMSGTSMATPCMTGVAALWLCANPDLTPAEIKEIARTTAKRDSYVSSGEPAMWGGGKLDAHAGIKKALEIAGVENIIKDNGSNILVNFKDNNTLVVTGINETFLSVSLYNVNGSTALQANAMGDTLSLDLSGIAPGVYILQVTGKYSTHSQKLAIR